MRIPNKLLSDKNSPYASSAKQVGRLAVDG
jgi:hypothetical protein